MTQDEIIRMAREAGFVMNEVEAKLCHPTPKASSLKNMLERFATLVVNTVIEKNKIANAVSIQTAVEVEREACAKVCDEPSYMQQRAKTSAECAAAIRARGEK